MRSSLYLRPHFDNFSNRVCILAIDLTSISKLSFYREMELWSFVLVRISYAVAIINPASYCHAFSSIELTKWVNLDLFKHID